MGFYHEHLGLPSCNQSHGLPENSPFIDRWLHPHWHVHVLPGFLEGMMPMMNWRLGPCIRCIPFHCLVIFSGHSQDVCQNWCLGCIVPSLSAGLPPSQNASIRGRYPWEQQEGVCACFFLRIEYLYISFPSMKLLEGGWGKVFLNFWGEILFSGWYKFGTFPQMRTKSASQHTIGMWKLGVCVLGL